MALRPSRLAPDQSKRPLSALREQASPCQAPSGQPLPVPPLAWESGDCVDGRVETRHAGPLCWQASRLGPLLPGVSPSRAAPRPRDHGLQTRMVPLLGQVPVPVPRPPHLASRALCGSAGLFSLQKLQLNSWLLGSHRGSMIRTVSRSNWIHQRINKRARSVQQSVIRP